jgi:hypothetical protein
MPLPPPETVEVVDAKMMALGGPSRSLAGTLWIRKLTPLFSRKIFPIFGRRTTDAIDSDFSRIQPCLVKSPDSRQPSKKAKVPKLRD